MNAFIQIKNELIRRGYDSAIADAQAAAYTSMMNDDAVLTKKETKIACDQIENMR
jgi:hypothetical protein